MNERPHKKLEVWKKSIDLVKLVYNLTSQIPKEEEYGLKSQLRRASVSVPSNIAEGLTRTTRNNKLHFLNIAQASLSEIDTQTEICKSIKYFSDEQYQTIESQLIEIEKLLSGLIRKIKETQ